MNAFYGFCNYLWLSLAVCNSMEGNGLWEIMWMTLFVIVFAYIGMGVILMIEFMYKMQHDPAFSADVMDGYTTYLMEKKVIRDYISNEK